MHNQGPKQVGTLIVHTQTTLELHWVHYSVCTVYTASVNTNYTGLGSGYSFSNHLVCIYITRGLTNREFTPIALGVVYNEQATISRRFSWNVSIHGMNKTESSWKL